MVGREESCHTLLLQQIMIIVRPQNIENCFNVPFYILFPTSLSIVLEVWISTHKFSIGAWPTLKAQPNVKQDDRAGKNLGGYRNLLQDTQQKKKNGSLFPKLEYNIETIFLPQHVLGNGGACTNRQCKCTSSSNYGGSQHHDFCRRYCPKIPFLRHYTSRITLQHKRTDHSSRVEFQTETCQCQMCPHTDRRKWPGYLSMSSTSHENSGQWRPSQMQGYVL